MVGAKYGLYAKTDIIHPDGHTGVVYPTRMLVDQKIFGESGIIEFTNLYFGSYYVKKKLIIQKVTLWTQRNIRRVYHIRISTLQLLWKAINCIFKDKFDKSLKLYKLMTTKPSEIEERKQLEEEA